MAVAEPGARHERVGGATRGGGGGTGSEARAGRWQGVGVPGAPRGLARVGPVTDTLPHPRPAAVIVLAAGEGTRMRSRTPKVLHTAAGRTLLGHVVHAAAALDPDHLVVVVGHARERVTAHLAEVAPQVRTVVQEEQNGTGHAVRIALDALAADGPDARRPRGGAAGRRAPAHHRRRSRAWSAPTSRPAPRPPCSPRCSTTRPGTAAWCAATTAPCARSPSTRTPTPRRWPSARSTPASTPSTRCRCARRSAGCARTTRRARSTSPTSSPTTWARAGRSPRWSSPTPVEISGVNDRVQLHEVRRALNDRLLRVGDARRRRRRRPRHHLGRRHGRPSSPTARCCRTCSCAGAPWCAATRSSARTAPSTDTEVGEAAVVRRATCDGARIGPEATVGPYTYLRPGTVLGRGAKAGGLRRDEGGRARRGGQGAAPELRRRRDHRRGQQHRRRDRLRQLRRRRQAPDHRGCGGPRRV